MIEMKDVVLDGLRIIITELNREFYLEYRDHLDYPKSSVSLFLTYRDVDELQKGSANINFRLYGVIKSLASQLEQYETLLLSVTDNSYHESPSGLGFELRVYYNVE
jgi:hypothetical protein